MTSVLRRLPISRALFSVIALTFLAAAPALAADDDEEEKPPGLDKSVVSDVIRSHMAAIKHCYEVELRKDPELAGTVTTSFTVNPKGTIVDASIKASTLKNKEVESCLVTEIKTWIFPEPRGGGSVPITYPFKFKPPQ